MAPTSDHKPKQFAFVLTEDEHRMLEDLAAHDDMSKAHLVRLWIRSEYLKVYPDKVPGASIAATFRALVAEISGAEHRTIGNIADRMKLKPARLEHCIRRVATRTSGQRPGGILERVDGEGRGATWELLVSRDKALAAIEAAGFDLDESLEPAADK